MPYNSDFLYTPQKYTDIIQEEVDAYNRTFGTTFTLNNFLESNVYMASQYLNQLTLKTQKEFALLQTNTVNFIKNQQALKVNDYGVTFEGLTNVIKNLDEFSFIRVYIAYDPNNTQNYETPKAPGTATLAFDYDQTEENDQAIANMIVFWAPIGIQWQGSITGIGVTSDNQPFTVSWEKLTPIALQVKLHYKYDEYFYGNKMEPTEIQQAYLDNFNNFYQQGTNFLPMVMGDLTYFPGLAYVNSEVSTDGGATWSTLNAVIPPQYIKMFTLALNDITLILDADS